MWVALLFISFLLRKSADADSACKEVTNSLSVVTEGMYSLTSSGEVYVLKGGITLKCAGDISGGVTWQMFDSKKRFWNQLTAVSRRIDMNGDKVIIYGSTITTRSQWAKTYSTQYRCMAISRSATLLMSNPLAIKIPYYTSATVGTDQHSNAQCCTTCSQDGIDSQILSQGPNIHWTAKDLLTDQLHDITQTLNLTGSLTACLHHQGPIEMGYLELLEVICWLNEDNHIINIGRAYPLDVHRYYSRGSVPDCEKNIPELTTQMTTGSQVNGVSGAEYGECQLETQPTDVLNASALGFKDSMSCASIWYYLSSTSGLFSISTWTGHEFPLSMFTGSTLPHLIFCCVTDGSTLCRAATISLASPKTTTETSSSSTTSSTTVTSSTTSTSRSSTTTTSPTTGSSTGAAIPTSTSSSSTVTSSAARVTSEDDADQQAEQDLKSLLDDVKVAQAKEETTSTKKLKPSHIVAIVFGSCALSFGLAVLLSLRLKDKCAERRGRYSVPHQQE